MKTQPQQPSVLVAAFYEFFDLAEPEVLQTYLQTAGEKARVQGTVLLAPEGLNGTLAGDAGPLRNLLDELRIFCSTELDRGLNDHCTDGPSDAPIDNPTDNWNDGGARGRAARCAAQAAAHSGDDLASHHRGGDRKIGTPAAQERLSKVNFSAAPTQPFRRFRVRIKTEIVTFRQPGLDPRREVGRYVPPSEWNALIERNDVRVIDVRNQYEFAIGTFNGAEDPNTENFTDFTQYVDDNLDPEKDAKIAMFCTGGIRCEKATSYLLSRGFQDVFHLEGGILGYLRDTPARDSQWQGECYVFDERVSLDHALAPGTFRNCAECGWPAQRGTDCPKCGASDVVKESGG